MWLLNNDYTWKNLQRSDDVIADMKWAFDAYFALNKHAAEQSKKLTDLKELQSMQFYKNYYISRLN